jgi:hypothetical protein
MVPELITHNSKNFFFKNESFDFPHSHCIPDSELKVIPMNFTNFMGISGKPIPLILAIYIPT